MKKTFLYIFIISVLFFGCNSKKDENKIIELENLNSTLSEENSNLKNQISELETKLQELEKSIESVKKELSDYITKDFYNEKLEYSIK